MTISRSLFVPLLLAGVFLSMPVLAEEDKYTESTLTKVGDKAPNIKLSMVEGTPFDLDKQRGKIVVLNFFATWCGPCREKLPHLEKEVWQRFKGNEEFAMLVVGREHTTAELAEFRQEQEYTFPIAADPDRKNYAKYAEKYIPRTYVIGRDGRIMYQSVGHDEDQFRKLMILLVRELEQDPEPTVTEEAPVDPEDESSATPSEGGLQGVTVGGEVRIRANSYRNVPAQRR